MINIEDIKPGDTVTVYRSASCRGRLTGGRYYTATVQASDWSSLLFINGGRDETGLPWYLVLGDLNRVVAHTPKQLQSAEVKPTAETDWRTALVVRDADGYYWLKHNEVHWTSYRPEFLYNAQTDGELAALGPITVIIDADGRNVEVQAYRARNRSLEATLHTIRRVIDQADANLAEPRP